MRTLTNAMRADTGAETVLVGGRPMLFEVAIRGMDADLWELARRAPTAQAIVDQYATLHFLRHEEEWDGYPIW